MINYQEIEEKWRKAWEDSHLFESETDHRNSYFVTAAFPYPNGPQHIGHLRTYGTADALSRYKRMRGYNVLYPMGFHATGTPVLALAKRIKSGDRGLINDLKVFHIPEEDIAKMTDPVFITRYFIEEIQRGMKKAGYSIDWRRKFVSTDPAFSKMVEWQFDILNKKGYLTVGKHPVGWCPNENNAVGMHDTRRDVEPEIEKVTAIKFRIENSDRYAVCATFRPETVGGVTNLFINQNSKYVSCRVEGEEGEYILAKAAAESLAYQFKMEVVREFDGRELLVMRCINPETDVSIPIFPGFFVDEKLGTGLVMSVPGHAPFDYVALERLRSEGYNIGEIKPIKVIDVEVGRSAVPSEIKKIPEKKEIPAMAYLEAFGADHSAGNDIIELATKLEYKEELHTGRMSVKEYEGMGVAEARKAIAEKLKKEGGATDLYMLMNESQVFCRCGFPVIVKVVDNQWFINYGNREWKDDVREYLKEMRVLPEKIRNALASAVDWIDLRAVVRSQGLGTKFPFDREKIIESLSDSTIYMSFYTISNTIKKVDPEKLKAEFFDFVFLGKGELESVSRSTGIETSIIQKSRESFEYWYRETSRHSGPDLIFNHLTMYLYNHIAVFGKERWPKQIVVSGVVLSEGEKMSKSLGNITPLIEGLEENGVDPVRAVVIGGADLISDSDYNYEAINGVKDRFEYIFSLCGDSEKYPAGELKNIDFWLYSRMNRKIKTVAAAYEKLELREVLINTLYNSVLELKRYTSRGGKNGIVVREYLSNMALMMQPITPYMAEELWHRLGNSNLVSSERWKDAEEAMISDKIELYENLTEDLIRDMKEIYLLISKKSDSKIENARIIVADDWKRKLNERIRTMKKMPEIMEYVKKENAVDMEKASKYVSSMLKKIESLPVENLTQEEEFDVYMQARDYIREALGIPVEIEREGESESSRADRALPLKPSIDIK